MATWDYRNPPVWEAAIGASLQQATLYDHYEVADVHKLFSKQFPRAERQPPIPALDMFELPAGRGESGDGQEYSGALPARWWFTTEDSRNLLQIQDDFIGRNWRRTDPTPATDQGYPGFDGLLAGFRWAVEALNDYNRSRGRASPDPDLFDVVYINHLFSQREDGTIRKFREMAPWLNFTDDVMKGGMAVSWLERGANFTTSIQAHFVGVRMGSDISSARPALRLAINARGSCGAWSDFYERCEEAHAYMRQRLLALTSEEVQATWL